MLTDPAETDRPMVVTLSSPAARETRRLAVRHGVSSPEVIRRGIMLVKLYTDLGPDKTLAIVNRYRSTWFAKRLRRLWPSPGLEDLIRDHPVLSDKDKRALLATLDQMIAYRTGAAVRTPPGDPGPTKGAAVADEVEIETETETTTTVTNPESEPDTDPDVPDEDTEEE